jgi:hypothetical protein
MSAIKEKIEEANQQALDLMLNAQPYWVGMKRVIDAVPGMKRNYILHSGPQLRWIVMAALPAKRHRRRYAS